MAVWNRGEVDVVIYAGLKQLVELGYHRIRFYQNGEETGFSIIDRVENSEPIWRKVEWRNGKPVLPERSEHK